MQKLLQCVLSSLSNLLHPPPPFLPDSPLPGQQGVKHCTARPSYLAKCGAKSLHYSHMQEHTPFPMQLK